MDMQGCRNHGCAGCWRISIASLVPRSPLGSARNAARDATRSGLEHPYKKSSSHTTDMYIHATSRAHVESTSCWYWFSLSHSALKCYTLQYYMFNSQHSLPLCPPMPPIFVTVNTPLVHVYQLSFGISYYASTLTCVGLLNGLCYFFTNDYKRVYISCNSLTTTSGVVPACLKCISVCKTSKLHTTYFTHIHMYHNICPSYNYFFSTPETSTNTAWCLD